MTEKQQQVLRRGQRVRISSNRFARAATQDDAPRIVIANPSETRFPAASTAGAVMAVTMESPAAAAEATGPKTEAFWRVVR
jgi:hypothetical protein